MLSVIFMSYHKQHLLLITDMHFGPPLWHIKTFSLFLVNRSLSDLKILQHFITSSAWMLIAQPPSTLTTQPPNPHSWVYCFRGAQGVRTSQTTGDCETSTDLGITIAPAELLAHCLPSKIWPKASGATSSHRDEQIQSYRPSVQWGFALAQWQFCLDSRNTHEQRGTREVVSPLLPWLFMISRPSR